MLPKTAQRMRTIPPYFFASLGQHIRRLHADGHDVIRMDIGSPDLPPPPAVIERLQRSAQQPDHHGYTPFGGSAGFKAAVAGHYSRRFGVELDPDTEVLGLIGSKEGLFHLTQAFVDSGQASLVPNPGYPVYATATRFAGGDVISMPLTAANNFLPDLDAIGQQDLARAKLMWLNYPNNPTGATVELEFFKQAVRFAVEHNLLLCHDAPYMEVAFDGYRAPSLLQVDQARQHVIEFNSLSKTYNMAGWRLGMAVGSAQAIEALYTLKSQVDTSHFEAMMDAGEAAFETEQGWIDERNLVYQERRDLVIDGLRQAGIQADTPRATFYVWARLPQSDLSSEAFCRQMLDEIHVSMTPGVAFGDAGEGYLRVSLGTPTERVRQAMERLADWRYEPKAKAAS